MKPIVLTFLFTITVTLVTEIVSIVMTETILPNNPFVSIWNAPSEVCEFNFGVTLNLSYFDIVANKNETFEGEEIVIFYNLGMFPRYVSANKTVNGGLPQLGNLSAHLARVQKDVDHYIPKTAFTGLAVIDMESWRPIFERDNYNPVMRRYIIESESLVRKEHPDWPWEKVKRQAAENFEFAARQFMLTTLKLCQTLRPEGKWGYYGYPNCFNYRVGEKECSNRTKFDNDRLSWMFSNSSAIMPSIYLSENFGTLKDKGLYVFGQLKEALRVKGNNSRALILPYSQFRYRDTGHFYCLGDLKNSIQQSMEAGLAGVALWGSSAMFRTKSQCEAVRDYVDHTLGPFVKNITLFSLNCSAKVCHSHGRCVRRDWDIGRYGKLPHAEQKSEYRVGHASFVFSIIEGDWWGQLSSKLWVFINYMSRLLRHTYAITQETAQEEIIRSENSRLKLLRNDNEAVLDVLVAQQGSNYGDFRCHCYAGFSGEFCQKIET